MSLVSDEFLFVFVFLATLQYCSITLRTDVLSLTNHKSPVSDAGVGQAPPGGREGIYWGL